MAGGHHRGDFPGLVCSVWVWNPDSGITGQSMTPELRSEDVVLMNRLSYDLGSPKRFDVVVFERRIRSPM
ncbi:MAG: S26 family signal peptidase [Lachnospiraceae bacterium]